MVHTAAAVVNYAIVILGNNLVLERSFTIGTVSFNNKVFTLMTHKVILVVALHSL